MSNYRIVTNRHEFRIQERKFTFWRRREYWADTQDDVDMEGGWLTTFYDTFEEAKKELERKEKFEARMWGEWKPVEVIRNPDIGHCPKCGEYIHDEMGA